MYSRAEAYLRRCSVVANGSASAGIPSGAKLQLLAFQRPTALSILKLYRVSSAQIILMCTQWIGVPVLLLENMSLQCAFFSFFT